MFTQGDGSGPCSGTRTSSTVAFAASNPQRWI